MSESSMPALFSERKSRSRLPTWKAIAWVLSSWACPSVMANSPSKARIFGVPIGAPTTSQNAALPGAAAKTQRVDGQHGEVGGDAVTRIARSLMLAIHGLALDHPQRVTRRRAMAAGQHELVAVRMFGSSIVVAETAQFGAHEVRRHIERRVRQRPAEVPGLRVVAEQREGHAGHEADVFQSLPLVRSIHRGHFRLSWARALGDPPGAFYTAGA